MKNNISQNKKKVTLFSMILKRVCLLTVLALGNYLNAAATPTPIPNPPKLNLEVWSNGWDGHEYQLSAKITNLDCKDVSVEDLKVVAWFYDGQNRTWAPTTHSSDQTIYDGAGKKGRKKNAPSVVISTLPSVLNCGATSASNKVEISFPTGGGTIPASGGYMATDSAPNVLASWHPTDNSALNGDLDYSPVKFIVGTFSTRVNSPKFALYYKGTLVKEALPSVDVSLAPGLDPNTGVEPCGSPAAPSVFDQTFQSPSWADGQSSKYAFDVLDNGTQVTGSQVDWALVGTQGPLFQLEFAELVDPLHPLLKQMTLPTLTPRQYLSLIGQDWGNLPIQQFVVFAGDGGYVRIENPNPSPAALQIRNIVADQFTAETGISIPSAVGTFIGNRYTYAPVCYPVPGLKKVILENSSQIPVTGVIKYSMIFSFADAQGVEREHEFRYSVIQTQATGAVSQITGPITDVGTFTADSGTAGMTRVGQAPLASNPTTIGAHDVGFTVRDMGDPVTTKDGILHFSVDDFFTNRPGYPIAMERYYNSRVNAPGFPLGHSWISNYDTYIFTTDNDHVVLSMPDKTAKFTRSGLSNNFIPDPGFFGTLAQVATQPNTSIAAVGTIYKNFQYTDPTGRISYFSAFAPGPNNVCKLTRQVDRLGNFIDLNYEGYVSSQIFHAATYAGIATMHQTLCFSGNWWELPWVCWETVWNIVVVTPAFFDSQTFDTRLTQVHSDSLNDWKIIFNHDLNAQQSFASGPNAFIRIYGALISSVQSYSGTQNLDRIAYTYTYYGSTNPGVSTFGEYSLTGVQRGTNASPTAGFTGAYNYNPTVVVANPLNYPVLIRKDDAKGHGQYSIGAEKASGMAAEGSALSPFYKKSSPKIALNTTANEDAHVSFTYLITGGQASDKITAITNGRGQISQQLTINFIGGVNNVTQALIKNSIGTYLMDEYWGDLLQKRTYLNGGPTTFEQFEYNADFLPNHQIDGNGFDTYSDYDSNGNLLHFKDQEGNEEFYTYDSFSSRLSYTNQNNKITNYTYNGVGNLLTIAEPMGKNTHLTHDFRGFITKINSPNGFDTTLGNDANGNVISRTDEIGITRTYAYDLYGRRISETDAAGFNITTTFNYKKQPIQVTYSDGSFQIQGFDADGNCTLKIDRNGKSTEYTYDTDDNCISETKHRSGAQTAVTQYQYDPNNNLTKLTDPNLNQYKYVYNPLGLIFTATDPNNHTKTFTFDGSYNLVTFVDEAGTVQSLSYQKNNLLKNKTFSNGDPIQTFTYDAVGSLKTALDAEGLKNYTYDDLQRLMQTDNSSQGSLIIYGYDLNGNLISLSESKSGRTVSYVYLNNNLMLQEQDSVFGLTQYAYDSVGRLKTTTLPNGVQSKNTFSPNGYTTGKNYFDVKGVKVWGESYIKDFEGNVLAASDPFRSLNYIYDGTYQLLSMANPSDPAQKISYTYDRGGNRLSSVSSLINEIYVNGPDNQLLSINGSAEGFIYDVRGNVTNDNKVGSPKSYTWDALGNLKTLTTSSSNAIYTYDYASRRIKKVSSVNGTKHYIFDGSTALTETDALGTVTNVMSPGIGFRDDKNILYYFVLDQNSNMLALTDKNGNLVQKFDSGPFGEKQLSVSDKNCYRFTGALGTSFDNEAGLNYMAHRWYDPHTGRFISKDPVGFIGGINLYGYVENNPVNRIDPSGLWGWWDNLTSGVSWQSTGTKLQTAWNTATTDLNIKTLGSQLDLVTLSNNFKNAGDQINSLWNMGKDQLNNNWNEWNSARQDAWNCNTGGTWQGTGTFVWQSIISELDGHVFKYNSSEYGGKNEDGGTEELKDYIGRVVGGPLKKWAKKLVGWN